MKSEDLQYPIVSNALKDVAERKYLENELKNLENVLDNYDNLESYNNIMTKLSKKHFFEFSFTNIHESQDCKGRTRAFFNSSLPLPPASQALRQRAQRETELRQRAYYCRELTSVLR